MAGAVSSGSAAAPGAFIGALAGGFNCRDSDGDTIIDMHDQCPDTPLGAQVSVQGCARDSDQDGVVDYVDACPHSAVSFYVDASGCPMALSEALPEQFGYKVPAQCRRYLSVERNRITQTLPIHFATNSAQLDATGLVNLSCLAHAYKGTSGKALVLEGYTDATGQPEYNQQLALNRISTVRDALIGYGISLSALQSLPLGSVQSSGAPQSRAQDRKVEVKVDY